MRGRVNLLILVFHVSLVIAQDDGCPKGQEKDNDECVDQDECTDYDPCDENAKCFNTNGSYYCSCESGYRSLSGAVQFIADKSPGCIDIDECKEEKIDCGRKAYCKNSKPGYSCFCEEGFASSIGEESFKYDANVTCKDRDECEEEDVCGKNGTCHNTQGDFYCVCKPGFRLASGKTNYTGNQEQCLDMCAIDKLFCGNGTCHPDTSGHLCACHQGFTNYANKEATCVELDCGTFTSNMDLEEDLPEAHALLSKLKATCVELSESEEPAQLDPDGLLELLLSELDHLLSGGPLEDNRMLSVLLDTVENALRLIGAMIQTSTMQLSSSHTELDLRVERGNARPTGPVTLSCERAQLDIQWETVAGEASFYPGFATVSLLTYGNLENSTNRFFTGMRRGKGETYQINSKVVTASVSNKDTSQLKEQVTLRFNHLKPEANKNHTCVYWESKKYNGTWSSDGCTVVESHPNYTVCSCTHLSSFAVLMALHEFEDPYEMQLITLVGLSLSLLCLFACILTFALIRSIQSPRNTIHMHLCICLFIANIVFLAGISSTKNQVGCAVVAGLLHFFYLAAFCWMCLEGVQLFRMVVLVFNTSFRQIYMLAGGYGVPAVIVAISALVDSKGYGTKRHCWLRLEDGFIWSFFGPVCAIIMVNVFFFLITVWKLAQKFSSLNPDKTNLHKIKAFTTTAVAQLCVLGTMWIFGCFQFEGSMVMSYLFTILNSLQGVLLFIMHCLLSKQVTEEYGKFFSSLCAEQKKKYSEFTSSHSSKAPAYKSSQSTAECNI